MPLRNRCVLLSEQSFSTSFPRRRESRGTRNVSHQRSCSTVCAASMHSFLDSRLRGNDPEAKAGKPASHTTESMRHMPPFVEMNASQLSSPTHPALIQIVLLSEWWNLMNSHQQSWWISSDLDYDIRSQRGISGRLATAQMGNHLVVGGTGY